MVSAVSYDLADVLSQTESKGAEISPETDEQAEVCRKYRSTWHRLQRSSCMTLQLGGLAGDQRWKAKPFYVALLHTLILLDDLLFICI